MFANQDLYRLSISTISSNKQQIDIFLSKILKPQIKPNRVNLMEIEHNVFLIELYMEGLTS